MTSEAQCKQKCTEILHKEETYPSNTICITEYNTINVNDIKKALKTLKNRKTPGADGINMELTKYCNHK
jgi:hypothetical protein